MSEETMVIADFDDVFDIKPSTFYYDFKKAFATAARSLCPDLEGLEAMGLAVQSWEQHRDCTTLFVDKYGIDRATMHRYAHRILDTREWKVQKDIPETIAKLQQLGQFIVWTHGSKQMVLNKLDAYGLYGQIKEDDIYDMMGPGRKDVGDGPYHKICEERQVKPENTWLVDDSIRNVECASQAGLNTAHVYLKQSKRVRADFIDVSEIRTAYAFRNIERKLLRGKSELRLVA